MGSFSAQLPKDPDRYFTMSTFENFWANKAACDDAERAYFEKLSGCKGTQGPDKKLGLSAQIDQARQLIKNSLECVDGLVSSATSSEDMALVKKLNALELQIMCTVEDEKVSIDELSEKIEEFEDFVQSCDVAAMNKI